MGSAMTWASPQHLTPFPDESPFRGLNIANDVTVSRQVLAEPSVELGDHTWARLTDGTPLVTGAPRAAAGSCCSMSRASPGWSSLPISGLYVEMLRRVVELSEGVRGGAAAARPARSRPSRRWMDLVTWRNPIPEATPLRASEIETVRSVRCIPPGLYGVQGALSRSMRLARVRCCARSTLAAAIFPYAGTAAQELKWPMLEIALIILLIDALISLDSCGVISQSQRAASARRPWDRRRFSSRARTVVAFPLSPATAAARARRTPAIEDKIARIGARHATCLCRHRRCRRSMR